MGDITFDMQQLSRESFRLDTYDANTLCEVKQNLAKAGFFYTKSGFKVKCFECKYEVDANEIPANDLVSLIRMHKEKVPDCKYAKELDNPMCNTRSKKFLSYDSLRYEKERLETFIEWPIPWLLPSDLAADGFYYLRTNDHCACVFCRGIVGAWETGDTPRGEHQRHFPHCPFIRGQPVGNVPMTHSSILDKLPLDGEECPLPPPRCEYTTDEAGNTTRTVTPAASATGNGSGRHMPGSYPECKGPAARDVSYENIGLRQYSGPKRKDYITKESRVKSYTRWPERVVQKPDEMAEAGFFYCGLSDHVRCFHCGSGLRNWEIDDNPWEEHARWYPDCNFVHMSKGQDFIDEVRRKRPPYIRSATAKDSKPQKVAASSGKFKTLGDSDLEPLMKLDIIQAVSGMGFPPQHIRMALRRKLERTGLPFFSLEPCIEAVLQIMEEETRRTLQASNDTVEDEAMARQSDKMQALNIESRNNPTEAGPSGGATAVEASSTPSSSTAVVTPTSTTTVSMASSSPITTNDTASSSSTVSVGTSENTAASPEQEAMDIDDQPAEAMETQVSEVPAQPQAPETPRSDLTATVVSMREADDVISAVEEALKPVRSGPSSLEAKNETGKVALESLEGQSSGDVKKASVTSTVQSQKDIAEELERIRESRICKICMDAEMDVVFLPCTHMATCSSCAVTMAQCPICRNDIKYTIKPIFS